MLNFLEYMCMAHKKYVSCHHAQGEDACKVLGCDSKSKLVSGATTEADTKICGVSCLEMEGTKILIPTEQGCIGILKSPLSSSSSSSSPPLPPPLPPPHHTSPHTPPPPPPPL
jgi:hypothetical protein